MTGEQHNLAAEATDVTEELTQELLGYLSAVHAPRWQEGITWKNAPFKSFDSVH